MYVSDLRHFLDLPDDVAGPARRMAERLTLIVRAATAGDAGMEWVSALTCDRRPGHRPCPGQLAVLRTDIPPSIAWHCTSCTDEGVISGWERSPYDLRSRHPRSPSADARHVVIPADAAATLRQLQVLDSDAERPVFSAEAWAEGVVLLGDDDDLDELMGYVAAEANHEPDQRRQRRLDDVFEILTRAIETPRGR
ncbi:MAG: hypothetical protein M3417_04630 [Actinomycetota bacterium]|nr:hypothetical protein [Actinomycetota bacterium]MDQ3630558.1 hypothetical protein [Actinomycetota bacterium]